MYKYLLMLHVLGATVWTGGHLVLAMTVLPKALRRRDPALILEFDSGFERIGLPALLLQVATGFWLAYQLVPDVSSWFSFEDPVSTLIFAKVALLVLTVTLAVDARVRIAPHLSSHNMGNLAFHIIAVTIIAVLLAMMGVAFRTGEVF
ncbi:MAG: CopD family protein [Candidatus Methylomirabilales bacterium]